MGFNKWLTNCFYVNKQLFKLIIFPCIRSIHILRAAVDLTWEIWMWLFHFSTFISLLILNFVKGLLHLPKDQKFQIINCHWQIKGKYSLRVAIYAEYAYGIIYSAHQSSLLIEISALTALVFPYIFPLLIIIAALSIYLRTMELWLWTCWCVLSNQNYI